MIRKSTIKIDYANKGKLEKLDSLFEESKRVINLFINDLWESENFFSKFVSFKQNTWLSARLQQCLGKQALEIVKSQRRKKKKTHPEFKRDCLNLDQRFVDVRFSLNTFDVWVKLSSIGNKVIVKLPGRRHKHLNNLLGSWNLSKSARLRKIGDHYYVDLYFEKEEPSKREVGSDLGCDIGYKKLLAFSDGRQSSDFVQIYEKIARKKQKSKAFDRALVERNQLINREINSLDLSSVKSLIVEDLKNVKKRTKGRIRKQFMNKLQRWTYPKVLGKFAILCEEQGISLIKVNPAYTSQTCSGCGLVDKKSRNGEHFLCTGCGMAMDADLNASINILHRGVYSPPAGSYP